MSAPYPKDCQQSDQHIIRRKACECLCASLCIHVYHDALLKRCDKLLSIDRVAADVKLPSPVLG